MAHTTTFPPGWYALAERIKRRLENEKKVKESGGDNFQQLEARLTDEETGKMVEDIVIYAIRIIDNLAEAKSFFEGYVHDVKTKPNKYPSLARKSPREYVIGDVQYALGYFTTPKTHRLWEKVLNN